MKAFWWHFLRAFWRTLGTYVIFPFISNIFLQSLGVKEVNKVVQIYTCKKQLSVSQKPHNSMIYGELGRRPVHTNSVIYGELGRRPVHTNSVIYGELGRRPVHTNTTVTAVKCWLKLLEQPYGRLPKAAYETLKMTDERGTSTWVTTLRTTLFRLGFGRNCMGLARGRKSGYNHTRNQTATCRLLIPRRSRQDLYFVDDLNVTRNSRRR